MRTNVSTPDGNPPGRSPVASTDPRYLDPAFWPEQLLGQTIIEARFEQCAAIDGHRTQKRRAQRRVEPRPMRERIGGPEYFLQLLPRRPWCADKYEHGIYRRSPEIALGMRHLQINHDRVTHWLLFDIDRPDAHEAADAAGLREPTFVAANPVNGHGHLGWLLAAPVPRYDAANRKPIEFLADIQRGMTRRLNADRSFPGVIVKNPLHSHWRTEWRSTRPFTLEELNSDLTRADKRRDCVAREAGEGRNCVVFEELRQVAYREVRKFYGNPKGFRTRLFEIGMAMNTVFEFPLSLKEVAGIARSIAKWTLENFSPEKFSEIQRARVKKRWAGHVAASGTRIWEEMGISRRTYYRRKAAGLL